MRTEYEYYIGSESQWLKRILKRNKEFKIDLEDLHDYFGIEFAGESPEDIYQIFNDILSKEGIKTYLDRYMDSFYRLVFSLSNEEKKFQTYYKYKLMKIKEYKSLDIDDSIDIDNSIDNYDQDFITLLKDHKIYDDDNKLLLCPNCYHYAVDFSNYNKWWCNICMDKINYSEYNLGLSDNDMYHIYKLCGLDALCSLTNDTLRSTKSFVASYFKKCCVTRKEKCLYFDYLKDDTIQFENKI